MLELNKIYNMDCIEGMKQIPDNSIDSIVTDPPYGLGFMGKEWDTYDKTQFGNKGSEGENDLKVKKNFNILPRYRSDNLFQDFTYAWAKEAYRILKPGGYLLSFGGTRTYHRMASAIEDAGFEIRDMINWTYGSGFPKSLNIGKAIDKLQGNERVVVGESWDMPDLRDVGKKVKEIEGIYKMSFGLIQNAERKTTEITKGTSEFEGWGTALKPAHEPIVVARKPIAEKSVAENVLKYGTGGINIDESRVNLNGDKKVGGFGNAPIGFGGGDGKNAEWKENTQGRFPANFIHDGSPEVLQEFEKAGNCGAFAPVKSGQKEWGGNIYHKFNTSGDDGKTFYKDGLGTPARFFKSCEFGIEDAPSFIYTAKASKSERNEGCEELNEKENLQGLDNRGRTIIREDGSKTLVERFSKNVSKNNHPTVKPLKLMEYLVKLVTPKDGVCLDPFMGSGTTAVACKKNGFKYLGFEKEAEYIEICEARLKNKKGQERLF